MLVYNNLQLPGTANLAIMMQKYKVGEKIGSGVTGKVYKCSPSMNLTDPCQPSVAMKVAMAPFSVSGDVPMSAPVHEPTLL